MKGKYVIWAQSFITKVFALLDPILLSPEVWGMDNLNVMFKMRKKDECAVVIICNHLSAIDPFVINGVIPWEIRRKLFPTVYPAKQELFSNKFKRFWVELLGCLEVGTGSGRNVREMIKLVKSKEIIFLFPEGSVSKDGKLAKDQGALTFFSKFADFIVLPIRIEGIKPFGKDWHNIFLGKRTLTVNFGEPFFLKKGSEIDAVEVIKNVK